MTKAYAVEIDVGGEHGTMYLGRKNMLSPRPYFFASSLPITNAAASVKFTKNEKEYLLKSIVVTVSDLEKGLRASAATRQTLPAFVATVEVNKKKKKNTSNLMYKIQLQNVAYRSLQKPKFAGPGKLGKIWQREQDVRSYITNHVYALNGFLKDALVVTLEIDADGCTSKVINRTPLEDFYTQNPKCKQFLYGLQDVSLSEFPEFNLRSKYD